MPLTCLGDDGRCGRAFDVAELQRALSAAGFEQLLAASLAAHVRTRPAELQYCPTADCPHVHRVADDGSVVLCVGSLVAVCTTCHAASHDGLSCAEQRRLAGEGFAAFDRWMRDNRVKACPACGKAIEKRDGCNPTRCAACRAHLCWVCAPHFSAGDIYDHVRAAHGGIDIEPLQQHEDLERDFGDVVGWF